MFKCVKWSVGERQRRYAGERERVGVRESVAEEECVLVCV